MEIEKVEATLGVKLPDSYLKMVRMAGEKPLDLCIYCLPSYISNPNEAMHSKDAEDSETMILCWCRKPEQLIPLAQLAEEGWSIRANQLDLLIVLAQEGPMFWCLNYRNCGPQGEPSIVLINAEFDTKDIPVAAKFRIDFTYYAEINES